MQGQQESTSQYQAIVLVLPLEELILTNEKFIAIILVFCVLSIYKKHFLYKRIFIHKLFLPNFHETTLSLMKTEFPIKLFFQGLTSHGSFYE